MSSRKGWKTRIDLGYETLSAAKKKEMSTWNKQAGKDQLPEGNPVGSKPCSPKPSRPVRAWPVRNQPPKVTADGLS